MKNLVKNDALVHLIPSESPNQKQILITENSSIMDNDYLKSNEYQGFSIQDHIAEQVQFIKHQQMLATKQKNQSTRLGNTHKSRKSDPNSPGKSVKGRAQSMTQAEPLLFTGPQNKNLNQNFSPRLILKPLADMSELEMILSQTRRTGP